MCPGDSRSLGDGNSHKSEFINLNYEEPLKKKIKVYDADTTCPTADSASGEIEAVNCNDSESEETLSKRQLKKLRKKEKWLAYKPVKRAREKEKLKQKKLDARLNNIKLGPSRKELKHSKMSESNCKIRVVIDLSFDDLMNDKEIGKCIKQLLRCYSLNRRARDPMQFYITSFNDKSKVEMQKHSGFMNWDVNFHSESYTDIFESKDLIYLTSESDNIITSLQEDKVYIIGGLVDHNSHKGLCYKIAQEKGIGHGQLPIGEFLEMKSRKVLTIDHVFQILLEVTGGKSWKEAFLQVLPQRKGAIEKVNHECSNDDCLNVECSTEILDHECNSADLTQNEGFRTETLDCEYNSKDFSLNSAKCDSKKYDLIEKSSTETSL